MKRGFLKKITATALLMSMIGTMAGCSPKTTPEGTGEDAASGDEVVLKYYTAWTESDPVGAKFHQLYDEFNVKYDGKIQLEVESIPGLDNYINKMKMLLASGDIPDLFDCQGYNLVDPAIKADAIIDLTPYMEADPDYKASLSPECIEFNTIDGKMYTNPFIKNVIGYWYNKDMFAQVGITPATTWDEFWANAEKLKAAGITPLALDTAESAWYTNLLLGAAVAKTESGAEFMRTYHPKDYNNEDFINGLNDIKKALGDYAQVGAVGANGDAAANIFLSGQAAMTFNGAWMAADFVDPNKTIEGFDKMVGGAIYPNDVAYVSSSFGTMVGNTGKEKNDAAVEFLKFMQSEETGKFLLTETASVPDNPNVEYTAEAKEKQPILVDIIEQANKATTTITDYQSMWYPNVVDAFTTLYPEFVNGKITAEEMAQKLTDLSNKNEQ